MKKVHIGLNVRESEEGIVYLTREQTPPVFMTALADEWREDWRFLTKEALRSALNPAGGQTLRFSLPARCPTAAFEVEVDIR